MTENELSGIIVNAAIEVHRTLGGPGLLESIYEEALVYELEQRGLGVERQKVVPLIYKGKRLAAELRVDLLIEGLVIIECKAAREDNPVFEAQTLTYLRLLDLKLGLVINFGRRLVKDGIHRVVNGGDVPAAVEFGRVAAAPVNTLRQQTHRCQEISVCL